MKKVDSKLRARTNGNYLGIYAGNRQPKLHGGSALPPSAKSRYVHETPVFERQNDVVNGTEPPAEGGRPSTYFPPEVFAWLIVIIIVGFLQDRLFTYLDRRLFPHKYYKTVITGLKEVRYGFFIILGSVMFYLLLSVFLPTMASSLLSLLYITLITGLIAVIYGEVRFQSSYYA